MKNAVEQIKQLLQDKKRIVAIGHMNPDGDAVGSCLALSALWEKMGHESRVLLPDPVDYTLSWMPGVENIVVHKKNPEQALSLIKEAEVIFCLDFNNLHRIGELEQAVRDNVSAKRILIDHHLNPATEEFDAVISTPEISSTAELTYDFIGAFGMAEAVDAEMATDLYVGIITDTGSLSYSTENTDVFRKVADLIDKGVDVPYVRGNLYNMFPESRLRLMGYALYAKMKILKPCHSAYIVLTQEELRRLHYQKGDTEGLVNFCIAMKNIIFGCIIIEHLDRIQLSFRSRGDFDVSRIASEYFAGGGHKNAAGGSSHTTIEETVETLEKIIRKHKKELVAAV